MIKQIKKSLRESLLGEKALRINELSENTALFIKNKRNIIFNLDLYCSENDEIYGTIGFSKIGDKLFGISGVAALRGFGPFIYELAMMYLNSFDGYLMPSRDGDVRGEAFNVWEKFYNRNDVIKHTFEYTDKEYNYEILGYDIPMEEREEYLKDVEENGGFKKYETNALLVYNTKYSLKSNNDYYELIERSKKYSQDVWEKALERGEELWEEKYE